MFSRFRKVRIFSIAANQAAKSMATACLFVLPFLAPTTTEAQPLPKITEPAKSFAEAKNHDHGDKVITIEGNFLERGLDEHVDNHLLVTFGNYVLIGRDGKRIKLWFDFAKLGLEGAQELSIEMVNKPHLRVKYDPECGLALKIEAIGPWTPQLSTVKFNQVPLHKNLRLHHSLNSLRYLNRFLANYDSMKYC
jgi:hypothetical protein